MSYTPPITGSFKKVTTVSSVPTTLTPVPSTTDILRVTVTQNFTLAIPAAGFDGQQMLIEPRQDGTGTRTMTLATGFKGSDDFPLTGIVLSTAAGKKDRLFIMYSADTQTWDVLSFIKGYTA